MINRDRINEILRECWSEESSTKFEAGNPSKGQCSVTSIIINRAFGGDILKTRINDCWHYYNRIGDTTYDFTQDQFKFEIEYLDQRSSVEEALTDCTLEQVDSLWGRFSIAVDIHPSPSTE